MIDQFSIINGAKGFRSGIFQEYYLVFIPALKYIKYFHATTQIHSWKSNGMSEENIENITKSDSNVALTFVDDHVLPDKTFNGQCLIKNKIYISKKINLYISYTLDPKLRKLNTNFTSGNWLFESIQRNKNFDPDRNKYTG